VIASFLRNVSLVCALIVLLSFAMFATDQASNGSKQTVATLGQEDGTGSSPVRGSHENVNAPDPSARTERMREKQHGQPREIIDDGNDILVAPFKSLVTGSKSIWTQRIVTTLLALLVFGFGLRMLAAWVPGQGRRS
jgi:hypothetical protein